MKFAELYNNIRIPISNEENLLYLKISKNKMICHDDLNDREKILVRQLLNKNLVNYKIKKNTVYYYKIT